MHFLGAFSREYAARFFRFCNFDQQNVDPYRELYRNIVHKTEHLNTNQTNILKIRKKMRKFSKILGLIKNEYLHQKPTTEIVCIENPVS